MLAVPLLVVGALAWFGVFLVRRLTDRNATPGPRQILEERFAPREFYEQEFERRGRTLREATH